MASVNPSSARLPFPAMTWPVNGGVTMRVAGSGSHAGEIGSLYVRPMDIHGFAAPGFEAVVEEFARNFTARGDTGAAFAVCRNGRTIVDIWGGEADPRDQRPWTDDTLQLLFSGTKGLVALCLLLLVDRGAIDVDAPVAQYWPEFAAHGKQSVTVAQLASHQARLPGLRATLTQDDLVDGRRLAAMLADQPQETDPRAATMYHPLTYGWLIGELVRRVSGRSLGRFFAQEIATPLALDLWIGLPPSLEPRVSWLHPGPTWGSGPLFGTTAAANDPLVVRTWSNPPILADPSLWNTRERHAAEIPAANAIGTARAMARFYACLANGGELDGVRVVGSSTLARGRRELSRFTDPASGERLAFAAGFQLQTELGWLGPPTSAFGHTGAGGSVHGAWPAHAIGFSYAMNQLRDDALVDARPQALLEAVHRAVLTVPAVHPSGV